MAAYAALVSLMNIIDEIQQPPRPPISLDEQQLQSLTKKVTFLQEFLEGYNSAAADQDEADPLEARIAKAAYAAEDVIESHIADQLELMRSNLHERIRFTSYRLYEGVQMVIEEMEAIKIQAPAASAIAPSTGTGPNKMVTGGEDDRQIIPIAGCAADQDEASPFETRIADAAEDVIESHIVDGLEEMRVGAAGSNLEDERTRSSTGDQLYEGVETVIEEMEAMKIQAQVQKVSSTPAASATVTSMGTGPNTMVGFDKVYLEITDKLTGGEVDRQIIQIAGMGGCGKTTLARNVYANSFIKDHFDICAWATISQECDATNVICELLGEENSGRSSLHTLGDKLRKDKLFGRRYLIIMDDMWSNEVWDEVQRFFPNNRNGSRIIITSRLAHLGSTIGNSHNIDIACLDEDSSWSLFCETVFGKDSCPPELIETGKRIVRNCYGLPLSIVVIGGLLAESVRSQEQWEYIGENISSTVNLKDEKHWLRVLRLSYSQLPLHLKPCFLYMGVFREDLRIRVSEVVRLWVAEGFLKPVSGKSMEVVGRDYLHALVDRNLVLVDGLGRLGNIKYFKLHDLLRDLCIREAEKERFYSYSVGVENNSPQRRLVILKSKSSAKKALFPSSEENIWLKNWENKKSARSLICHGGEVEPSADFRLLRVSNARFKGYERQSRNRATYNSRYLAIGLNSDLHCCIQFTWNLQSLFVGTLIIDEILTAPVEIWNMSRLRYVRFPDIRLPEPPMDGGIALGNLQVIKDVRNFKLGKKVVERIPNIKKLRLDYYDREGLSRSPDLYGLSNIQCLHKLESLTVLSEMGVCSITLPHSLKKLRLNFCPLDGALLANIGSLPLLENLTLMFCSIRKWETVDGQFPSLKYLELMHFTHLEYWTTESSHFPRLEQIFLSWLRDLKKFPSEIGEIPTLKSISLEFCNESLVRSVKEMMEEQEELQGEQPIDVEVVFERKAEATQLQSLASANFRIRVEGWNDVARNIFKTGRLSRH